MSSTCIFYYILRTVLFIRTDSDKINAFMKVNEIKKYKDVKCDICDKCPITPFCRNVTVSFHRHESTTCNETADLYSNITLTSNQSCVNWHQYYTDCKAGVKNPFQGAISFDNIGLAWVAIFQVSTFHYVIVSI